MEALAIREGTRIEWSHLLYRRELEWSGDSSCKAVRPYLWDSSMAFLGTCERRALSLLSSNTILQSRFG